MLERESSWELTGRKTRVTTTALTQQPVSVKKGVCTETPIRSSTELALEEISPGTIGCPCVSKVSRTVVLPLMS